MLRSSLLDRRVAVVLGGGGVIGAAFHAGSLLALSVDHGWDPRDAEVVVGTSAGSLVAAMLRLGWSADNLAAIAVGATLEDPPRMPIDASTAFATTPHLNARPVLRMPSVAALRSAMGPSLDWMRLMSALVPGVRTGDPLVPGLGAWPDDPLWVCAVSEQRLERTVFGKDIDADLSAAVQASCAIPGLVTSPEIGGAHYLDGGIHSPTNADLLVGTGVDVAVISSPMSGARGAVHPMGALIRWSSRRLAAEVRALRDAGIEPVVIEPDLAGRRRMGHAMLSSRRRRQAVAAAFDTAGSLTARLRL